MHRLPREALALSPARMQWFSRSGEPPPIASPGAPRKICCHFRDSHAGGAGSGKRREQGGAESEGGMFRIHDIWTGMDTTDVGQDSYAWHSPVGAHLVPFRPVFD